MPSPSRRPPCSTRPATSSGPCRPTPSSCFTETDLDWDDVYAHLKGCRVLIAAESRELTDKLRKNSDLDIITLDPEPVPPASG